MSRGSGSVRLSLLRQGCSDTQHMSPAWNRTTFRISCRGAGWRVTRVLGKQPTVVIKDLSDSGLESYLRVYNSTSALQ
jgi:hypothetical protein